MRLMLQSILAAGLLSGCISRDPDEGGYPSLIPLDPPVWAVPEADTGAGALAARAARLRARAAGLTG
jgi:hypothetical protein